MKKFIKIVSLITLSAMTLSLSPAISTAFANDIVKTEPINYEDVRPSAWYAGAVKYVSNKGIMTGTSASSFEPEGGVTRAMVVQLLYKMSGDTAEGTTDLFSDVRSTDWYANAVSWAKNKGIAGGYEDGSFKPEQKVTREELAAFIYRFAGSPEDAGMALQEYDDCMNIAGYARPAMLWCVHNNLVSGMGENLLVPKGIATRAQLASIAMRYYGL